MAASTSLRSSRSAAASDSAKRTRSGASRGWRRPLAVAGSWLLVGALVALAGYEFYRWTGARPSYDAFGWMVWGRQVVLHWSSFNTDGAPSWKPLTFLLTLPYALFGHTQLTLWTATSSAAALASGVFAARSAFRLTGLASRPLLARWPALIAGTFAGVGVLGLRGLPHQMLIATSDPMVVTLCLAALDAHLSRRPRLAFAMLVLAALGRPEVWTFAGAYAVWCWRAVRGSRILVAGGVLLIPAGWFVIPALTSHSWFISGDLALGFRDQIYGNKIVGVFDRFTSLYELPMQLAALGAIVLAVVRRDRTWLALTAAAALWVAIEIAFAYHGWPASQRYLMEPAAVCIVLAGAAVGQLLDFAARGAAAHLLPALLTRQSFGEWVLRAGALSLVAVLALSLAPVVRARVRLWRGEIHHAKIVAVPIDQLEHAVAFAGGPTLIRYCGQPVTFVGFQSTLAWNLDMNVGNVGYKAGREIHSRRPIVFFAPFNGGWLVRPLHTRRRKQLACRRVSIDYQVVGQPTRATAAGLPPALAREVREGVLGPLYLPRRLRPGRPHHVITHRRRRSSHARSRHHVKGHRHAAASRHPNRRGHPHAGHQSRPAHRGAKT